MARYDFGGVMAAWVVSTAAADDEFGAGVQALVLPNETSNLTLYDAPNGTQVTDLLDVNGVAISTVPVPAGDPYIPKFSGPDGVQVLWTQSDSGHWLPMPRFDDGSGTGTGGGGTGDVQLSGANTYEYADSQSAPWLLIKRPNDNSDSSVWQNMIEVQFWDNTTSQYRQGWYVNEKGLLRTRGTTPSDVVARFMAHPSQSANVPVLEIALNDNTVKLAQFFTGKVILSVPITVPYLVNPLGERLYWGTGDPSTDPAYADYRPDIGAGWVDYNNPPVGG